MNRVVVICVCINIIVGTLGLLPLMGWNRFKPEHRCILSAVFHSVYVRIFGAGVIQITTFCIIIIYSLIGRTAIIQKNKITATTTVVHIVEKKGFSNKLASWKSHTKAAKNLLLVIVVFTVCTLPYSIIISIISTPDIPVGPKGRSSDLIELISLVMLLLNSCVNPIIYSIKFPKFRRAFKTLLHMKQPSNVSIED